MAKLVILLAVTLGAEILGFPRGEWFFAPAYLASAVLGGAEYRSKMGREKRRILLAGLVLASATTAILGPLVGLGCLVAGVIGVVLIYSVWPL